MEPPSISGQQGGLGGSMPPIDVVIWPRQTCSLVFGELAESLAWAYRARGHDVAVLHGESPRAGRRAIFLGVQPMCDPGHAKPAIPDDAIYYNTEQVEDGQVWGSPAYVALLEAFKGGRLWDYHPANAAWLEAKGLGPVTLVPIGWAPPLVFGPPPHPPPCVEGQLDGASSAGDGPAWVDPEGLSSECISEDNDGPDLCPDEVCTNPSGLVRGLRDPASIVPLTEDDPCPGGVCVIPSRSGEAIDPTEEDSDEGVLEGEPPRPIDVLFYGAVGGSANRAGVLGDVRLLAGPPDADGVPDSPVCEFLDDYGVWGAERQLFIQNAKVCLNVHYYPMARMELVRMSLWLANGAFIISESSADPALDAPFAGGIIFGTAAELPGLVRTWLYERTQADRDAVAARGRALFEAMVFNPPPIVA